MPENHFDVLIVGAGPAGVSCAMALGRTGLSVAVLDKASFPRDKICGDALSVDVVNQLSMLSPELGSLFHDFEDKTASHGVRIFSPDRQHIDIPFLHSGQNRCGYLCRRFDFDNLLAQHLKQFPAVHLYEGCAVTSVIRRSDGIAVQTDSGIFEGRMLVGAEGAYSVVSKYLGNLKLEKNHYCAGLRVYYEGVSSFSPEQAIELHFFRDILPGYLWIFPLPDNKANVGIGMLSSAVSKTKVNLRETLQKLLATDPALRERFKNARPMETVKGHGLPLGSKKRKISGAHVLLTGDAASLIDPFSGEGIANAIRSGRVAAEHILKCFAHVDFSESYNSRYDREIYRRMWKELKVSRALQGLCRYPWLLNFVVRKANQNRRLRQVLVNALADVNKKSLLHPGFYYELLFK